MCSHICILKKKSRNTSKWMNERVRVSESMCEYVWEGETSQPTFFLNTLCP